MHIKNIGIIDEVTINFEDGLNILTGETGAGKSLIIDSINAITGSRMSKDIIKYGESMALVEACFFDADETKILTREFFQNGRNVCKIDGRMVTLGELKEIGENLIDIHGQHDNQSLLNEKTHLNLLDSFASKEILAVKEEYKKHFEEYKEIKEKIKNSFGDPIERARRIDLLKYQKDEIEQAKLSPEEEHKLEEQRNIMMNAEKIVGSLKKSYGLLDESVLDNLGTITYELSHISNINQKYEQVLQTINDSYYSLKDATSEIMEYAEEVDFDEKEQREVEERMDLIFSLKRKYGNDVQKILEYLDKISEELNFLENSEEIIQNLENELNKKDKILKKLAGELRKIRKEFSEKISKKVNEQLVDLEMKKAHIEFEFKELENFNENGMDAVQILICTNAGEGLKPLTKIASGGEVSRVMLALKTVLCMVDEVPTMIFDEIDTGISGQAGKAVADKMKIIGKTHQVISVTHLPVIAAAGDSNYYIEKNTVNDRTATSVKKLNEKETVNEVARIIAGNDLSDAVIKHAKELRKNMK
ncbi:MAG: DNA repair protein RecN [Clostridia bacterium]|nr:DNA repair protein RecN [Clostridia bacterium]